MAKRNLREALFFAARLRAVMETRKLRPTDLVEALDVEESTVSRWINGKVNPPDKTKLAIAKYAGIDAAELLPPDPSMHLSEPGSNLDAKILERLEAIEHRLPTEPIRDNVIQMAWAKPKGGEEWRRHVALFFLTGVDFHLDHKSVPTRLKEGLRLGMKFYLGSPKKPSPKK